MLLKILRIHGHSMEPVIKNGSAVFVSSVPFILRNPKKDDIVALKFEDKIFIKRIRSVLEDKYYLEGDNKRDSLDSREIGLVNRENIVGKVLCIIG